MTETIDTANLRALAEAADAQPYNIIATGYYTVAMNKLKARPEQVVALLDRLAAAEARNATLTDDAAHADRYAEQLGRELAKATGEIQALTDDAARYRWLRDAKSLELTSDGMEWTREDGTKFRASHRLCAGQTAFAAYPSLDETIDAARAAASISTKADGPGCTCQASGGPDYCERHAP